MSMFGNLNNEGLEETQDRLGGYEALPTDIYLAKIKAAYGMRSSGGALGVVFIADVGGKEYRETLWVTNKKGENFFLNKQDNTKKVGLPGFTTMEDICLVTTNKPLNQLGTQDKMFNVYDPEQKKEVPTSVPMLMDLVGQELYLGILREIVFKQEKDANGNYQDTAETRTQNTINKVFHYPSKMTVVEAREEASDPVFFDSWKERNAGKDRDQTADRKGGNGGRAGQPPVAGQQQKTNSLFGNKS